MQSAFDDFECGQQVWRDVAGFSLGGFPAGEAHTAALHEAEEEPLLFWRVALLPDHPVEIFAREAPRVSQPGYCPATVENSIDGVERPVLIKNDAAGEEVSSVEHDPRLVEVVDGVLPGENAFGFVAKGLELFEGERSMLSLLGLAILVLASPGIELAAYLGAPLADLHRAVFLQQVAKSVPKVALQGLSAKIFFRAVGAASEEFGTGGSRWT
jgi:hypothetical protein